MLPSIGTIFMAHPAVNTTTFLLPAPTWLEFGFGICRGRGRGRGRLRVRVTVNHLLWEVIQDVHVVVDVGLQARPGEARRWVDAG